MAPLKKRLIRLHSAHAHNDSEGPKHSLSIPPGALGELVAERKRQYLLRSSPHLKNKSPHSSTTLVNVVMESPPAQKIDEHIPDPKLQSPEGFTTIKNTQARRSLRHVVENDSEDDLNFPSPHNLPPTPPATVAITTSLVTNTRGNHANKETHAANTRDSHANQSSPAANTRGSHANQSSPVAKTRGSHANQRPPDANTREIQQEAVQNELPPDHFQEEAANLATNKVLGTKRKRGPTKMRGLALQTDGPITVRFNSLGQSVGEGSVSLSSFLGPLVREIVPYTIPDWRKVSSGMKDILWTTIQVKYLDKLYIYFMFILFIYL